MQTIQMNHSNRPTRVKLRTHWDDTAELSNLPDAVTRVQGDYGPGFLTEPLPDEAHALRERLSIIGAYQSRVGAALDSLRARSKQVAQAREEAEEMMRSVAYEDASDAQRNALNNRRSFLARCAADIQRLMNELGARLRPYSEEQRHLRMRQSDIEEGNRTAKDVHAEVKTLEGQLSELREKRRTADHEMGKTDAYLKTARQQIEREAAAAKALDALECEGFMAPDPDAAAKVERKIADAKAALSTAQKVAIGARAALPTLEQRMNEMRTELADLDAQMAQVREAIKGKQAEALRLTARANWTAAVQGLRKPLAELMDADPQTGHIVHCWLRGLPSGRGLNDCRGLQVFGVGGLVSPAWLRDVDAEDEL